METIAIQGVKGSNHHIAAMECFSHDATVLECQSFDAVINSLLNKEAGYGIMALENSIVGSILPNYALIDSNNLHVYGEHYLHISHNLMALPGETLETITEVHSHYMALLQCKAFFKHYPHIKLVESPDTALAAKHIQESQLRGIAALAPAISAQLYALEIIASDVQTIDKNATRFVLVAPEKQNQDTATINKASLKFELDHKRGSLATALNVMSDCKLSLTKIQSLPILETSWKYAFFVDVVFQDYRDYQKAKSMLEIMATHFKVVGEYKNNKL